MSTFVLVPGMWIGAWAWRDVTAALRAAGHDVHPLTLTGVADRAHLLGPGTDLDTHVQDILGVLETEDLRDVILVGHSYGGLPVTAAAERVPDRLARLVYVDSGPLPGGASQLDQLSPADRAAADGDAVAPRDWDPSADPQLLAGLSPEALTLLRTRATPHPAASVRQPLSRTGTGLSTPITLISCVYAVDDVRTLIAQKHPWFTELADAELIGLPTGHWPMLSEPQALAAALIRSAAQ